MCGICDELHCDAQFPDMAALTRMSERLALRGPFLELMRGILPYDIYSQRCLCQRTYVDKLMTDPGAQLTRIHGSKLWHLAALEWWLRVHVDGEAAHV